jgi:hypothetical protein
MSESLPKSLLRHLRRLIRLYGEGARLLASEKLTLLLSGVALVAVVMALGLFALVFLTLALTQLLLTCMSAPVAYMLVGGFYVLLALLAIGLRRPLIINPIARAISRLLLDPPTPRSSKGHGK